MHPDVFYTVIGPLLMVERTACIMISTPLGQDNFYHELCSLRTAEGKRFFNVQKVGMACDRCSNTERESECTHPSNNVPEWHDTEGHEKVKAMLVNRQTTLKREIMGIPADMENAAFPRQLLQSLTAVAAGAGVTEPHEEVRTVYVAIDPNGGGSTSTGSESAIASMYFSGANVVICGLDTFASVNGIDTRNFVARHLDALRSMSCLRTALFVLVPESNLGNEAQEIGRHFVVQPNVHVLSSQQREYGVWTSDKSVYVFEAQNKLELSAVHYHARLATARWRDAECTRASTMSARERLEDEASRAMRKEFERQMAAFQRVVTLPNTISARRRVTYTGKANGEHRQSSRLKDDLCMAFLIGLYWAQQDVVLQQRRGGTGGDGAMVQRRTGGINALLSAGDCVTSVVGGDGAIRRP